MLARSLRCLSVLAVLVACRCADSPVTEPPVLASLGISPAAPIVVGEGGTITLTAAGFDETADTMPAEVTWSVSDTTIATVAQDGSVTGRGAGSVTVRAVSGWIFAETTVHVAARMPRIDAGGSTTCAMAETPYPWCWGAAGWGQLGSSYTSFTPYPRGVWGGHTFVSVSMGGLHACGITVSADAYCWGLGQFGALGDGGNDNYKIPVLVAGGHEFAVIAPNIWGTITCAVTKTGQALCWGGGAQGPLGTGDPASWRVPVAVADGHVFSTISAGAELSCGLTTDGHAWCWGYQPPVGVVQEPALVSDSLGFADISASREFTCALSRTARVLCWGEDTFGKLGNEGTRLSKRDPTPVTSELRFRAVSAGEYHACALTIDGEAYCWGRGDDGRLGTGTTASSDIPAPVAGGLRFTEISAGGRHTCARTAARALYCWGANDEGQLGTGDTQPSLVPVPVVAAAVWASPERTR